MFDPVIDPIPRERMLEAVRLLGLDPTNMMSLTIDRTGITIVIKATNTNGELMAKGNDLATVTALIPYDDQFER